MVVRVSSPTALIWGSGRGSVSQSGIPSVIGMGVPRPTAICVITGGPAMYARRRSRFGSLCPSRLRWRTLFSYQLSGPKTALTCSHTSQDITPDNRNCDGGAPSAPEPVPAPGLPRGDGNFGCKGLGRPPPVNIVRTAGEHPVAGASVRRRCRQSFRSVGVADSIPTSQSSLDFSSRLRS